MKKKKFDPINFIPNQSKYQRGIFNESFEKELEGLAANEIQRELLLKKSNKHINKKGFKSYYEMRKAKYRMNLHEINSKIFSFMSVDKAIDNGL